MTENQFLGVLCKRGHRYQGQDRSLRAKRSRSCCQCGIDRKREDRINRRKGIIKSKPKSKQVPEMVHSPTINQGDLIFSTGRPLEEMLTRAFIEDDYYVRTV